MYNKLLIYYNYTNNKFKYIINIHKFIISYNYI